MMRLPVGLAHASFTHGPWTPTAALRGARLAAKDTSSRVRAVVGCGPSWPLRYAYSTHTGSWREGRRNGLTPCALAMVVVLTLLGRFLARAAQWRYVLRLPPLSELLSDSPDDAVFLLGGEFLTHDAAPTCEGGWGETSVPNVNYNMLACTQRWDHINRLLMQHRSFRFWTSQVFLAAFPAELSFLFCCVIIVLASLRGLEMPPPASPAVPMNSRYSVQPFFFFFNEPALTPVR